MQYLEERTSMNKRYKFYENRYLYKAQNKLKLKDEDSEIVAQGA